MLPPIHALEAVRRCSIVSKCSCFVREIQDESYANASQDRDHRIGKLIQSLLITYVHAVRVSLCQSALGRWIYLYPSVHDQYVGSR